MNRDVVRSWLVVERYAETVKNPAQAREAGFCTVRTAR